MINPKNCILCKSKSRKAVFSYSSPDKYEKAIKVSKKGYKREWVKCSTCGFHYSIYSRDPKIIDKVYTSAYRDSGSLWRGESPEEIFKKITALPKNKSETKLRVEWIKKTIDELISHGFVKKGKAPYKFLDIGGGAGIFAYEFKDKNWKPFVIDPAKNSTFIKTKLKIPLVQSPYKPKSFKHKFNLITAIYVLEHLKSPIQFLKDVKKDMDKNSLLFIEVPDSIAFRLKPKNDEIFNSCHLWMFNPTTLTKTLNNNGFEIFSLRRLKTKRNHYGLMALTGSRPENS